MSAKKGFETKIPDDENIDSGFLSGPIARYPDEEEDVEDSETQKTDSDKVQSVGGKEVVDLDSGLDLCLSECLDHLSVEDSRPRVPALKVTDETHADIPPISILFQQDDDGDTQLHIAAVHGCKKSVGTLINVCPEKYLLDLPNDYGHTALHLAVLSGHAVVVRMLVQEGASLKVRDLNGNTPVHLATATGSVECLQALLAPVDKQSSSKRKQAMCSLLSLKNYDGQACIHLAASSGDRTKLQTLIYHGADINDAEHMAGWTPLHIAARRGDVRLAQHLLQTAGIAVSARDYGGRTPRRLAAKTNAFKGEEAQRLLASLPEDSDESDSDDEYDSDGENYEALFERLQGQLSLTSLVS